jgi:hypothetical protein
MTRRKNVWTLRVEKFGNYASENFWDIMRRKDWKLRVRNFLGHLRVSSCSCINDLAQFQPAFNSVNTLLAVSTNIETEQITNGNLKLAILDFGLHWF